MKRRLVMSEHIEAPGACAKAVADVDGYAA